jgi:uncharacterized protein (TIGR03437 family)
MHHKIPQFALTTLAFLAGARGIALGQTPNVWAWGLNAYGQLGNGNYKGIVIQSGTGTVTFCGQQIQGYELTICWPTPVNEDGSLTAVAVAAGKVHSLGLASDGTVWAWGDNSGGELGDTTLPSADGPIKVSGLTGVFVAIAAGLGHSMALKSDGTVWAWGLNAAGELGNGNTSSTHVPVQVSGLTAMVAIAAGGEHSLALASDGTVWAWGFNGAGGLGNGNGAAMNSNIPVHVSGLTGAVAIACGEYHSLALTSDGKVWSWGNNANGELGTGNTNNTDVPVQVSGLTGIVAIAGAAYTSFALESAGTVLGFGYNADGELGNGNYTDSNVPVQVSGLTGVVAIAAGQYFGLAVSGGTAWTWGDNENGELGNGTTVANNNVPVAVSGLTGVVAIAGGFYHALSALGGNGTPDLTVSPASITFGANGQRSVTVTNQGDAPLSIGNITLTGINPADFSISGTCSGASLSPTQTCALNVTFAPTALGTRTAAVLLTANAPGSPIPIWLSGSGTPGPPPPTISAVVSASSFGGFTSVAPGSWVEIYGSNLAPDTREWAGSDFSGDNAPTSLDGVEVTIGGQKAFIDYISSAANGQINAQLPSNIATGGPLQLTVNNGATTSSAYNIMVNATEAGLLAPTAFQVGGNQYVVAQHKDGSYVLPAGAIAGVNSSPAQPGETVLIYGVGFGPVAPNIPAGEIVTEENQLSLPFQLMFGQTPAQLKYDGLAPNYVGLYQFDVVVPSVPDNDLVPLTFNLGGTVGTQKLFAAVHQ